jgi:hypothetical protein
VSLNNEQIERYSRQILVLGGLAQERLLASRLAVFGSAPVVEPALRYLVGAGVGRIWLHLTGAGPAVHDELIAHLRALNSRVTIESEACGADRPNLHLIIDRDREELALFGGRRSDPTLVAVRLDPPARIALIPPAGALSPTAQAALRGLSQVPSARAGLVDTRGFVIMVAVTEVLKILAAEAAPSETTVIDFDGYEACRTRLTPA